MLTSPVPVQYNKSSIVIATSHATQRNERNVVRLREASRPLPSNTAGELKLGERAVFGGDWLGCHRILRHPDAHGPSYGEVWGPKPLSFEGPRAVWSVWAVDH